MPFSHNLAAMSPSHFNIQQEQQISHKYDQQFIHRSEDTLSHSSYHNIARLNMVSPLIHQVTQNSSLSHSAQSLSTSGQPSSLYGYDSVNLNYPPSTSNDTYQFSNNYQGSSSGNNLTKFKCLKFYILSFNF